MGKFTDIETFLWTPLCKLLFLFFTDSVREPNAPLYLTCCPLLDNSSNATNVDPVQDGRKVKTLKLSSRGIFFFTPAEHKYSLIIFKWKIWQIKCSISQRGDSAYTALQQVGKKREMKARGVRCTGEMTTVYVLKNTEETIIFNKEPYFCFVVGVKRCTALLPNTNRVQRRLTTIPWEQIWNKTPVVAVLSLEGAEQQGK